MITKPTTAQLIDEVRRTLASTVAPAVDDPQVQGSLQMIDHILSTLAIRAENELAWMLDEIDDIERVAGRVAGELPEANAVVQALDALRNSTSGSRSMSDVIARYALASEALSCVVEATMSAAGPLREEVGLLLDRRLGHETDVIGEFQLVGRG